MKQLDPDFGLKSKSISDEDLQELLYYLDTGNEEPESNMNSDFDSEELDPFSGTPIDNRFGYDPYHSKRQISIRKCSSCGKTFDSFVGIETSLCNRCRAKLGLDLLPEAGELREPRVPGKESGKNQRKKPGTPYRSQTRPRDPWLPDETSRQSSFTDDQLFEMLRNVGSKKHP